MEASSTYKFLKKSTIFEPLKNESVYSVVQVSLGSRRIHLCGGKKRILVVDSDGVIMKNISIVEKGSQDKIQRLVVCEDHERVFSEIGGKIFFIDIANDFKIVFTDMKRTHSHHYVLNIFINRNSIYYSSEGRKAIYIYDLMPQLSLRNEIMDIGAEFYCYQIHEKFDNFLLIAGVNSLILYDIRSSTRNIHRSIGANDCLYSCMKINYKSDMLILGDQYGCLEFFKNYLIEPSRIYEINVFPTFSWIFRVCFFNGTVIAISRCEKEVKILDVKNQKVSDTIPTPGKTMDLNWGSMRKDNLLCSTGGDGKVIRFRNLQVLDDHSLSDRKERFHFLLMEEEEGKGILQYSTIRMYGEMNILRFYKSLIC